MNPGKAPARAAGVPNPPPVLQREVDIQGAFVRDEYRMVEPRRHGEAWLIIDDEQVFNLCDLE